MKYTVHELAELAGVSARTLRYYDEIALLAPEYINDSGYRVYTEKQVDLLQQILFYRELGFPLQEIKVNIKNPRFDMIDALESHREKLERELKRIQILIQTIDKSIENQKGDHTMNNEQKFEGLKKELLFENEQNFGEEIREKYGEETVESANKRFMGKTEDEFNKTNELAQEIIETIHAAMDEGDPQGELAQRACELHKQWLLGYWDHYTPEAHYNLTQMYLDDPRFLGYYDKQRAGTAAFLNKAMAIFTNQEQ